VSEAAKGVMRVVMLLQRGVNAIITQAREAILSPPISGIEV